MMQGRSQRDTDQWVAVLRNLMQPSSNGPRPGRLRDLTPPLKPSRPETRRTSLLSTPPPETSLESQDAVVPRDDPSLTQVDTAVEETVTVDDLLMGISGAESPSELALTPSTPSSPALPSSDFSASSASLFSAALLQPSILTPVQVSPHTNVEPTAPPSSALASAPTESSSKAEPSMLRNSSEHLGSVSTDLSWPAPDKPEL